MGNDFDCEEEDKLMLIRKENHTCVPYVRVVDGRNRNVAEEVPDPRICLLD
jgi:hypothetical protein